MTPRSHPWWHAVESRADDSGPAVDTAGDAGLAAAVGDIDAVTSAAVAGAAGAREPWADRPFDVAGLTSAQKAVLAGLEDQPHGPRLDGVDPLAAAEDQPGVPRVRAAAIPGSGPGNGTGRAPGDPEATDPHTRTRWTEQEQQEG